MPGGILDGPPGKRGVVSSRAARRIPLAYDVASSDQSPSTGRMSTSSAESAASSLDTPSHSVALFSSVPAGGCGTSNRR